MKTPEEYYNSKSKQQSSTVAGFCFLVIIILGLIISLTSCNDKIPQKQYQLKYKQGDVVYLKPDSTKAVVVGTNTEEYTMDYIGYSKDINKPGSKIREDFMEYEIY
jgi:hypothetical protein